MALSTAPTVQWPAKKVRDTFLNFFKNKGHRSVPSSSVIPFNDPSLLFINAGMCQYKSIFLGTVDPHSQFAGLTCATNYQKCIRAGGKHNDLDDVGKDSYHHTFFEMLGNWSFGIYFKKEAIENSWELLTKTFGLDPDRLYITYFEGYAPSGLDPDYEAKQLWLDMGVSEDHILPGNMKDNFWEMGNSGPCGPCIEIHYDRIGGRNAKRLVNQDDPNVIEIWNVVFIQFNRESDKSLRPLPNKHIDTGLGFERLVSILQNKSSNYDTDVFSAFFEKIQETTKARPYQGHFGKKDVDGIDTAYRVVADHVRTCTIAISDGAIPGNAGQGYVVRRICRRGVRYGRKYFNAEVGSFLSKMVPTVVKELGYIFPEIQKKEQEVKEILDQEEQAFALTLDRGEIMLNKYAQECRINDLKNLPGAHVWRLYDTFGFPIDLTKIMAEEQGLSVNDEEVCAAQDQARIASKGGKKSASNSVAFDVHDIATLESMVDVPKTNDIAKYKEDVIESTIKALYHNGKFVNSTLTIPEGEQFGILLDETNFYAESGGQESDTGRLVIDGVAEMTVRYVQSYRGYVLHTGHMEYGSWSVNDRVSAAHDGSRRQSLRMNHTGTHILNFALREVLGREVEQKGSLVAPNKLRFGFSHRTGLTEKELKNIIDISEKYIQEDKEVFTSNLNLSIAKQIQGVRTISGEIYPDPVRVVSIGMPVHELVANVAGENGLEKESWKYSVELCGGTHVARTSELQKVVIVEECAVAKGVRRIVAITGAEALEAQRVAKHFEEERLARLKQLPCTTEKEVLFKETQAMLSKLVVSTSSKSVFTKRLEKIGKDILKEQKEAQKAQVDAAIDFIKSYFQQHQVSTSFVAQLPTDLCAKTVFESIKIASATYSDKSIYLIGVDHVANKVAHGCFVSPEHTSKGLVACKWTEQVAGIVGGKAGGKGSTSVGTGNDVSRVQEGVEAAVKVLEDLSI